MSSRYSHRLHGQSPPRKLQKGTDCSRILTPRRFSEKQEAVGISDPLSPFVFGPQKRKRVQEGKENLVPTRLAFDKPTIEEVLTHYASKLSEKFKLEFPSHADSKFSHAFIRKNDTIYLNTPSEIEINSISEVMSWLCLEAKFLSQKDLPEVRMANTTYFMWKNAFYPGENICVSYTNSITQTGRRIGKANGLKTYDEILKFYQDRCSDRFSDAEIGCLMLKAANPNFDHPTLNSALEKLYEFEDRDLLVSNLYNFVTLFFGIEVARNSHGGLIHPALMELVIENQLSLAEVLSPPTATHSNILTVELSDEEIEILLDMNCLFESKDNHKWNNALIDELILDTNSELYEKLQSNWDLLKNMVQETLKRNSLLYAPMIIRGAVLASNYLHHGSESHLYEAYLEPKPRAEANAALMRQVEIQVFETWLDKFGPNVLKLLSLYDYTAEMEQSSSA